MGIDQEDAGMPNATVTLDATLKARLVELANQTGQGVDDFVEALLRRVAEADVQFDRGVPVFRRRPGAPVLTVEDVDRLTHGDEA
jgi:hypothetical protein